MWVIKQKPTNKFIDTDNSIVVIRGEGRGLKWQRDDGGRLDFGFSTM